LIILSAHIELGGGARPRIDDRYVRCERMHTALRRHSIEADWACVTGTAVPTRAELQRLPEAPNFYSSSWSVGCLR